MSATTEKPAERRAGTADRARLRLLAAVLPVTAALYMGAEAFNPKGTDEVVADTATGLRLLPIAAAHSSQLYLSGSLTVLALGGVAVSYAAIARLVTGRGWIIATIAAVLGGLGAFAGAMFNVLNGINLVIAASAHTTQLAAARFLVASYASRPAEVAEQMGAIGPKGALYMLPFAATMILLAARLWRTAVRPAPMTNPEQADAGRVARSTEGI